MAETLTNCFADVTRIYSDFTTDATLRLRLANIIHKQLVEEFRLATTEVDLVLDTTNREYALSETYVAIWSANYLTSATAKPFPIFQTSYDQLDEEEAGWRDSRSGRPTEFYDWQNSTGGALIGFDRIPATASVAGYPTVRLVVSVYTAFTAASDTIPAVCRDNTPYVAGIAEKWAEWRNKDDWEKRVEKFERAKNELGTYRQRRQRRNDPRLIPMLGLGARSV